MWILRRLARSTTITVHVVGGNVPRDSFLLKLSSSDWISAHGHVKSGVSIVYHGGVLTQVLQAAWRTAMWFRSVPVISFEINHCSSSNLLSQHPRTVTRSHLGLYWYNTSDISQYTDIIYQSLSTVLSCMSFWNTPWGKECALKSSLVLWYSNYHVCATIMIRG